MSTLDFSKMNLKEKISCSENEQIICIDEKNLNSSRNLKQLKFITNTNSLSIKMLLNIEQYTEGIYISPVFENVCKGINIDYAGMDSIILKLSQITQVIKENLEADPEVQKQILSSGQKILLDSLIINNFELYSKMKDKQNVNDSKDTIIKIYNQSIPTNIEFINYKEELFLFGVSGFHLAELLKELNIADYEYDRSGFYIKFKEESLKRSNEATSFLTHKLAEEGFITSSLTLELMDYMWNEG